MKRVREKNQQWSYEVKIACHRENPNRKEGQFDYGCACYESALKAFKSLCEDEHSGMSIQFTKAILNRLIDGKPLTPIDDTDEMWDDTDEMWEDASWHDGCKTYQCKRMSSLFKYVYSDGTVTYTDTNRIFCFDINNPKNSYYSGFIARIIYELFPISMPYMPYDKIYKVYTEDFLAYPEGGDFDTVGVFHVITPLGDRIEINRYFKDGESGYAEIAKEEYLERKSLANERVRREMKE